MTVKLIYCINRLPDMSVEDFQTYWWETHGPIAGAIKGVRRYVQCHTLPETYAGGQEPAFDGAAQLSWDSVEAMGEIAGTPEVRAALEDEKKFIDHSRVAMTVTEEKAEVDNLVPNQDAVKLIACLKRKDGSTREEFDEYWGGTHAPLVKKIPGVVKYVRCLAVGGVGGAEPAFDGVAEVYFSDLGALGAGMASPDGQAVAADTAKFADSGSVQVFITRERVVVG
jgi:uncharacterized protein (TIGR02118 family)